MNKTQVSLSIAAIAVLTFQACGGGSSGSAASTAWLESFAQGLAISSPTATSSSSASVLSADKARLLSETNTVDPKADAATKSAALEAIAKGETAACTVYLPNLGTLGQNADCYGPQVAYSDHVDCAGAAGCTPDGGTADADGNDSPNDTDGDDTLPTGDLGIWDAAASSGEACAAAQMNQLMSNASAYVDASLLMQAAAVCVLNSNGTALPGTGETVDFTSSLSGQVQSNSGTPTISSATVTPAGEGYEFNISGTSDGAREFSVTIRHVSENADNTNFKGVIYGNFNTQNKDAFSVVYNKTGDDVKAKLAAGSWSSDTASSDIFDSDGIMNVGGSFQGNMNYALINANLETGVGTTSYAWQAGSGDDKTRVFNVYTAAGDSGLEGCGFFGFGGQFSATLSQNDNGIDGFICNWAGVGNDHSMSGTSGWAQKQCFAQNSEGLFAENVSKRKIRYWPSVACSGGSGMALSPYPDHNSGGASTTSDLVSDLAGDTDFSTSYTAPTEAELPDL